jgi:hypothetical protein
MEPRDGNPPARATSLAPDEQRRSVRDADAADANARAVR